MPTWTATVRSMRTVSRKVVSSTATSLLGVLKSVRERPPLAHVVRDDHQDRRQRRQRDQARPLARERRRTSEHRHGVDHAGDRRAAAVLDVGRGARDRAGGRDAAEERRTRCWRCPAPTSSTLDLWRLPIMPSATTAESSDSIAASRATVTAGEKSSRTRSSVTSGRLRRRDRGVDLAEARADRLDREAESGTPRPTRRRIATIGAGNPCARPAARATQDRERAERRRRPRQATTVGEARRVGPPLRQERRGHRAHRQARAGP